MTLIPYLLVAALSSDNSGHAGGVTALATDAGGTVRSLGALAWIEETSETGLADSGTYTALAEFDTSWSFPVKVKMTVAGLAGVVDLQIVNLSDLNVAAAGTSGGSAGDGTTASYSSTLVTLADIIADVKLRLSEPTNTPAGALASGTGSALDQPTDATITGLANEAIADLCKRGGLAIDAQGTLASVAANVSTIAFSGLTVASGGTLWAAYRDGVTYNGGRCGWISRGMVSIYRATAPPGQYFCDTGTGAITLISAATVAGLPLTVSGLAIPPLLVNTTDDITAHLDADMRKLISFYCCHYIALKNVDDPTMEMRAGPWGGEYEAGRVAMLQRLMNQDPTLYQTHYAGLLPQGQAA